MKYVLDVDGGWLWYFGRMLLQLFRHPWLGGLLLAATLTAGTWMLGYLLRLSPRWRWLQYVPAFLYMGWASYEGLDLFFEAETGRILGPLVLVVLGLLLCGGVAFAVRTVQKHRVLLAEEPRPTSTGGSGWILTKSSWMELAILVVGFAAIVGFDYWRRPYARVISEMMIAQYDQDWARAKDIAHKHAEMSNRPFAAYYAISLVHTDQICERLYDIRLEFDTLHIHGMDGGLNAAVSLYLPEGSYHGGFMLTCIHQCMEQMVMTGPTVRLLHLLVKSSLMRGEWDVCEKYLRILRDVPFESDFCAKYARMVRQPDLVNADPEMAKIRLTEPMRDSFESMYQQPTFLGYNLMLTEGRSLNALYNSLAVCLYTKLLHDFVARLEVLRGSTPPENIADGILLATNNYPGLEQNFQNMNLRTSRIQSFMNVIQPYMQSRAEHADELFPRYHGYYPYYYFFGNLRATSSKQTGYVSSSSGVN
ncbi:MAG: DUF6057 family protein [Bacteroidaceae bacterium]|nr:DUF6057 family protein [Bacteroidaceae bacterium]